MVDTLLMHFIQIKLVEFLSLFIQLLVENFGYCQLINQLINIK